jgi:hypothetical protein
MFCASPLTAPADDPVAAAAAAVVLLCCCRSSPSSSLCSVSNSSTESMNFTLLLPLPFSALCSSVSRPTASSAVCSLLGSSAEEDSSPSSSSSPVACCWFFLASLCSYKWKIQLKCWNRYLTLTYNPPMANGTQSVRTRKSQMLEINIFVPVA